VISVVFVKGWAIFTTYNHGSPDMWRPGSELQRSSLKPAVSGTAAHSQSYNYSASCSQLWLRTIRPPYIQQRLDLQELLSFSKFEKFSLWCPQSKHWMTQVCGRSLAAGTNISYNDIISALNLHEFWRNMLFFPWIDIEKFFSLTYWLAKLFWMPLVVLVVVLVVIVSSSSNSSTLCLEKK